MYRKAHWKVYKVFIWEDSSQERWRRPQSNGFVLFQTLIIDIYQLHWSLEYMYIHKTTINLLGVSAIILKNISQYCCMYNNRIYIEKFYCTYILSITSVTSYPQRHSSSQEILTCRYRSNDLMFNSIQSTAAYSVPSVSVRFLKYVHTTDDLTYKNRCCLVSWQLDVQ